MSKAVILDRDGVINSLIQFHGGCRSPFTLEEFKVHFFKEKFEKAVKLLRLNDCEIFVATNQPWIDSGQMSNAECIRINEYLKTFGVEEVFVAIDKHDNYRYKPYSGMYKEIVRDYNLDQTKVWVVGDRWKDIVPGWNLSMKTILCCPPENFLETLKNWPDELDVIVPNYWASDIVHAARIIVSGGMDTESLPKDKVSRMIARFCNE